MQLLRRLRLYLVACGVSNIKNVNFCIFDCKENSVLTAFSSTIKEFADFLGKFVAFGGKWAALRLCLQRIHRLVQPKEPPISHGRGCLVSQPFGRFSDVGLGGCGKFDLVFHDLRGNSSSRRMSANASSSG